jgi:hypothetical protein
VSASAILVAATRDLKDVRVGADLKVTFIGWNLSIATWAAA